MRKSALISFLPVILPFVSAVSLSNFQGLTVSVTKACANAYGNTIPACTVNDFINGATCSSGCVSGLNQIAENVIANCGGTVVGSSTLLGRIFNGAIVTSLCPHNSQSVSSAQKPTTTTAPTTTVQSSTQAPVSSASSIQSSTTVASSSSITTSSTTSSLSTTTSSSLSSTAAQSSSSNTVMVSSSTTIAGVSSTSSSTSSSAAAQTSASQGQSGNGRSGMTVPQQQIAALRNSGGGSPFDIIGYSAAPRLVQRDLIAIALGIALLVTGWLLQ